MVKSIAAGQSDPKALASLTKGSFVKKKPLLIKALKGKVNEHHRFMLNMISTSIDNINDQIAQLEAQMDKYKMKHK